MECREELHACILLGHLLCSTAPHTLRHISIHFVPPEQWFDRRPMAIKVPADPPPRSMSAQLQVMLRRYSSMLLWHACNHASMSCMLRRHTCLDACVRHACSCLMRSYSAVMHARKRACSAAMHDAIHACMGVQGASHVLTRAAHADTMHAQVA